MATLLFFDDFYLNRWENLRRRIGQPELVPEATFSDPEFWLASGYPTVFRDATGIWRCLYQGKPRAEPQEPRYPLGERRFRNQVMPVTRFREWDCYFDARAEDPRERLKALVTHPPPSEPAQPSAAPRPSRPAPSRNKPVPYNTLPVYAGHLDQLP